VSYIHASLALPSGYNVAQATMRQVFVSLDRVPNGKDDVYWLNNTQVIRLNAEGGNAVNINSIAFSGTTTSGVILAGYVNPVTGTMTVPVKRTIWTPNLSAPVWQTATIPPTGPGNALVVLRPIAAPARDCPESCTMKAPFPSAPMVVTSGSKARL
jgi:hypothetical protein